MTRTFWGSLIALAAWILLCVLGSLRNRVRPGPFRSLCVAAEGFVRVLGWIPAGLMLARIGIQFLGLVALGWALDRLFPGWSEPCRCPKTQDEATEEDVQRWIKALRIGEKR